MLRTGNAPNWSLTAPPTFSAAGPPKARRPAMTAATPAANAPPSTRIRRREYRTAP